MENKQGFTIVELLVVIVVIGVLSAISLVSYTGINSKAIAATLQSDLSIAAKQLKLFNVDNGVYPASVSTNCTANPDTSTNKCLKLSSGNELDAYSRPTAQTFILSLKNGSQYYEVTESTQPISIVPDPLTAVAITGLGLEASTLSTSTTTPNGAAATASYQWQRADNSGFTVNLTDITNATNTAYTLTSSDVNKYVRVKVVGSSRFPGTVYSVGRGPIVSLWMPGLAGTTLAGKFVRNADLVGVYQYKITNTAVTAPQGSVGLDPDYPSYMSLVSPQANPGVDFSAYPAQNACKAIGGRLPNTKEMYDMTGMNTLDYDGGLYWTSTEIVSYIPGTSASVYNYSEYSIIEGNKTDQFKVRCVKD